MSLVTERTSLSSNTDSLFAAWNAFAETSNSYQNLSGYGAERRKVVRNLAFASIAFVTPNSVNAAAVFDYTNANKEEPSASGSAEKTVLDRTRGIADIRDTYPLVRRVLGGTVSQTASFYGVSRKTLYQWIGSDDTPQVRERQLTRSIELFRVAKYADALVGKLGRDLTRTIGEHSLLDLLSGSELNFSAAALWLDELATLRKADPDDANDKSLLESLKASGAVLPPGEDGLDILV